MVETSLRMKEITVGQYRILNSVSNSKGVAEIKTLAAIPCYNEGLAIGSVVSKARKYVDAVLVVDDGNKVL
jgi:hypothetical protein